MPAEARSACHYGMRSKIPCPRRHAYPTSVRLCLPVCLLVRACVRACVCVCVRTRYVIRVCACIIAYVRVRVHMCGCACVCACMCVHACVCMCVHVCACNASPGGGGTPYPAGLRRRCHAPSHSTVEALRLARLWRAAGERLLPRVTSRLAE